MQVVKNIRTKFKLNSYKFLVFLISSLKNPSSIYIFNLIFIQKNKALRFGYDRSLNLFFLTDPKKSIFSQIRLED